MLQLKSTCLNVYKSFHRDMFIVIPEGNEGGFNSTMFNYYLRTRLIDIFAASLISSPEEYELAFNAFRWFYVDWPYLEDGEANREAFNKVINLRQLYVRTHLQQVTATSHMHGQCHMLRVQHVR
jgi:hypothetical protein